MGLLGQEEGNFKFNDIDFSDRVLLLKIAPALPSNRNEVSNTSEFCLTDLKIKKIHINSLMLAYKSQFFYKLFKNGMKETNQRGEVALRIDESEEAAFMDLLNFIYDHSVNASSGPDLVGVLMAADKFEVPACIRYCVKLLLKLPISTELALTFLELPSSVLANEVVQTLTESAKSYICAQFRDFTKSQKEAMSLPLCAVELVIGSDGLQVDSEDDVFDFILKWGRLHYPEMEERREVLTRLVMNLICLPKMSSLKLKGMLDCSDFNYENLLDQVVDALFCKDQDVSTVLTMKYKYPKRIYKHTVIVQVVQLHLDRPSCLVYFDLTKKECANLVPLEPLYSQTFCVGGLKISLLAQCSTAQGPVGLYLKIMEGVESCNLDLGFSVMKKSAKEFTSLGRCETVFQRGKGWGFLDAFETSWAEFLSDESEFFIDGVLHLQANITLIS